MEGLGGGGYEVVGRPITGRGSEKGDLFGKGTVVRIGEEIALQRAELAETDKEPLGVAFLNITVLPVHERTRLEAAWQIQLVDRSVNTDLDAVASHPSLLFGSTGLLAVHTHTHTHN